MEIFLYFKSIATQPGRLNEFDPESDSIKAYLERVALYFTANEVDNAKRVPILLSSIGAPTYALLSDLVAPSPPSEKSFTEISEIPCLGYRKGDESCRSKHEGFQIA